MADLCLVIVWVPVNNGPVTKTQGTSHVPFIAMVE